jgi:hypothetical protein
MKMKSLLWTAIAFLFIGVEVSIAGIDLLPDVLGYVILFAAFSVLTAHEPSFTRPRLITAPLALLHAALLLGLVDNETVLFVIQVAGVLLDLLMAYFAFIALGRLAAAFEQDQLRRPVDSGFLFYALVTALPLIAVLLPELERLIFFAIVCLSLYVFNLVIRCYRHILLPVPVEEIPEINLEDYLVMEDSSAEDMEGAEEPVEDGLLLADDSETQEL